MRTPSPIRFCPVVVLAIGGVLAVAGCQNQGHVDNFNNGSKVAGHSGPSAPGGDPINTGGGPAHAPATNESHVGPTNAGPAGSQ